MFDWQDNVHYLRFHNILFTIIHLAVIIALVVTCVKEKDTMITYYSVDVSRDFKVVVYPIYICLVMHSLSSLVHLLFAVFSLRLVHDNFSQRNNNPYSWTLQFLGNGMGLMGIMSIFGIDNMDTFAQVYLLYLSVLTLCYFQNEYLNPHYDFLPGKEPHFFAIPIYATMAFLITLKSYQSDVVGSTTTRITMVSLFALFQLSLMFLIQRMHISKNLFTDKAIETAEDVEEEADKLEINIVKIRRALFYEILQYVNNVVFQVIVSWLIISLTRAHVDIMS